MISNRLRALASAFLLAALAAGCESDAKPTAPTPEPAPQGKAPKAPKNMPPGGNKMD